MTTAEEKYVHFIQCTQDLNDSWRVLTELRDTKPTDAIAGAAFRYALIAYAKPYMWSRGNASNRHKLDEDHVPAEYGDLHARLLQARNEVHAHSDISIRDARLYVHEMGNGGPKIATQVRDGIDVLKEYPRLDSIIDLIERTLTSMYEEAERLEQALPVN